MAMLNVPYYLNSGGSGSMTVNTSNLAVSIVAQGSTNEVDGRIHGSNTYLYAKIQYSRYQKYGGGNISPIGRYNTYEYHGSFANTGIPVNKNTSYKVTLHQHYYGKDYQLNSTGWFTMP